MIEQQQHLDTLSDIKRIMERSSRYGSLSGLSAVFAGVVALVGAWIAYTWLHGFYADYFKTDVYNPQSYDMLMIKLILLAIGIMALALAGGIFFTWRRAKKNGLPLWDKTSRNVFVNGLIPMAAGGAFVIGLLFNNMELMVAPVCLIFYGLALVNASKYTFSDIRYLGIAEVILGIVNVFILDRGLLCWALGFGVLHILYGALMWWKYEREAATKEN